MVLVLIQIPLGEGSMKRRGVRALRLGRRVLLKTGTAMLWKHGYGIWERDCFYT
jgi:hypothetical protein